MQVDWTTTIGATGDRLVFALSDDNGLIDVGLLAGAQLRIRKQNSTETFSFDVVEYTDTENDPVQWNAAVEFTDFTGITPGVYLVQVVGEIDGAAYRFPRDKYNHIRFLAGV